jgi:K+-sensing histidine kinase KdpD
MVENLINDLMDIGKLQKGVFRFENEFFSLPSVIQQAFNIVKVTA